MHFQKRSAFGPEPYVDFLNSSSNHDTSAPGYLGYNYPLEIQHLVHQHWRGYPQPEIYALAFYFIGYAILMFISLFGNGLVVWIFSTSKSLRTPSNLLLINLAVFDLVMCTNMPQYLINACFGYVVGGDLACDIYAVCGSVSGMGASMSNAVIAYDRFRTISNPIDGRLSFVQIYILIGLTWVWTVPFTLMPLFQIWGRYLPEGFLTTCTFDYLTPTTELRYFVRSLFTWAFCIPFVLICTNYTRLFLHVRDHERMLAAQAKKMNVKSLSANANDQAMSVEMRIAKASVIIYMLFMLAWLPYASVALLSNFGYSGLVTPFISMLPSTTCKFVSCVDPWVYAASHPKYRLELERRIPWLGIREKHASASTGTGSVNGETTTVSMDTA